MANPFVYNFDNLLKKIKEFKNKDFVFIEEQEDYSIFEKLLVQSFKRNINGEDVSFVAIRNIVLKNQYKSKGLFSNFMDLLEQENLNIMLHDIINDDLLEFFKKRNYETYIDTKNNEIRICMFKLNNDFKNELKI